jgi:protein tyrosine/serine phosphatase
MIHRFQEIMPGLYRGSAPDIADVVALHKQYGVSKIVSLDEATGKMIDRACAHLGIEHIMLPLDHHRSSLIPLLKKNLWNLLMKNKNKGSTFIHCAQGKDRTGFLSALFEVRYLHKDPRAAIEKAEKLGFGKYIFPDFKGMIQLYRKIILKSKPEEKSSDENNADIVSNEREYVSDNRSSFLDEGRQSSFAPFSSETRQYPYDPIYNAINDQRPTRENYSEEWRDKKKELAADPGKIPPDDAAIQVGLFNNDAGGRGFGPVENSGGFFYD